MSDLECAEFRSHPDSAPAVALRRIDDRGKVVGLGVPGLDAYRAVLGRVVSAAR